MSKLTDNNGPLALPTKTVLNVLSVTANETHPVSLLIELQLEN
jgi:hypothetical protein